MILIYATIIWIVGNPAPGPECFHTPLLFASSMTLYNLGNLMLKCSTNQKRHVIALDQSEALKLPSLDNACTVNGSETLSRHVLLLPEYTLSLFTEYSIDISFPEHEHRAQDWKLETQFVNKNAKKFEYIQNKVKWSVKCLKQYILARLEACVMFRIRIKSVELSDLD